MSGGDNNIKVGLLIGGDASGAKKALGEVEQGLKGVTKQGAEPAAQGIDEVGAAAQRAEAKATPAHRKVAEGVKSISEQLSEVKLLYAGWIAAQQAAGAVAGVAATADAYANLTARIKLAVGEGAAFQSAFQGVQDVALRTNTSLESTGLLFTKLADAGKQMGYGQAEALRLTETVNQAIQLSGASAQASEAAVTQFIQGLQSGVLRGDEFNSIMEQSPRLARALADGLGVTTGALRKMAEAGQLTADTVIGALQGQASVVEQEFGKLPLTIGRAITDLQTQWQLWIGTLDESSGASRAVSGTIEALAKNFDLVASSLINAGQAWLGWKAYNMAAEFLSLKAAVAASAVAKTADTAATVANTTATASNTAAQVANAAAKKGAAGAAEGAAVSAGRLAGALSLVKGFGFAFLVTNLVDIGKWLGEAAAKAMGYGKAIEDAERQMKAMEAATKAQAQADAELASKKRLAADAALGLSERGKKLVADFGEMTEKGETAAAAIGKIGKDFDLANVGGIADAGAVLDALAQRGQLTAEQVRVAWQQALDGQDLRVFEANAMAAFDGSEQGARRLAAALEAQLGEALRRTGLDAGALSGGVNQATQKAINDLDVLMENLDALRNRGVDTGVALAASLDQAGKAASTESAARLVISRWEELGKAGLVTGDRLSEGLEKARQRLDELVPGVTSVNEAFRALGMKAPEELKRTADVAAEAFATIKRSSDFSAAGLQNVNEAWRRMTEAAIAANGGVATGLQQAQASMYGYRIEVDEAGKAMVRVADSSGGAAGGIAGVGSAAAGAKGAVDSYTASLRAMAAAQDAADRNPVQGSDGQYRNRSGQITSKSGTVETDRYGAPVTDSTSVIDRTFMQGRSAPVDAEALLYQRGASVAEAKAAAKYFGELQAREAASLTGNLGNGDNAARAMNNAFERAADLSLLYARQELASGEAVDIGLSVNDFAKKNIATANWRQQLTPMGGEMLMAGVYKNAADDAKKQPVNITINGQLRKFNAASLADANALADILRQLQSSAARSS